MPIYLMCKKLNYTLCLNSQDSSYFLLLLMIFALISGYDFCFNSIEENLVYHILSFEVILSAAATHSCITVPYNIN